MSTWAHCSRTAIAVVILILVALPGSGWAQTSGRLAGTVLDSTTEQVVRHAHCPVLAVMTPAAKPPAGAGG